MSLRLHLDDLHYDLTDLEEQQERALHDEHLLVEVVRNVDGLPETAIVQQHVMVSRQVKTTSYRLEQVSIPYHSNVDHQPTNALQYYQHQPS